MKKLVLAGAFIAITCMSFTETKTVIKNNVESVDVTGSKITLINDTSEKLKIHTGSGSVSLNQRGGKTSFSCNVGKKVKAEGKVIFTISDDLCGTTVYLSKYIK